MTLWPEVWVVDPTGAQPPTLGAELAKRSIAVRQLKDLEVAPPLPQGALFFGQDHVSMYLLGRLLGLGWKCGKQPIAWYTFEPSGSSRSALAPLRALRLSGMASPKLARTIAYQLVRREPGLKRRARA